MRLFIYCLLFSPYLLAQPDPLDGDVSEYQPQTGLTAAIADDTLTVNWAAGNEREIRLKFTVEEGTPTIAELSARVAASNWRTLATGLQPEYRVTTGIRRVTMQQTEPLEGLGIPLTAEQLNEIKWNA